MTHYARTLGAEVTDAGDRRTVRMAYSEHLLGRTGFLHGGAIASLLSLACKEELAKALGGGAGTTSKCVSANYEFVRGGREADATATATIVHRTSRTASVRAIAWQDDEAKPIAVAVLKFVLKGES